MCPVSVFHNYQLLFSCCKKSTSPLVLVKYKVYSYCCNCGFTITIFKIFLPSLFYKLPWYLLHYTVCTLPLILDSNLQTSVSMNANQRLYFDSPYKLSKEAKSLRRAYDPNPLLICRVFELSYWLCPVIYAVTYSCETNLTKMPS